MVLILFVWAIIFLIKLPVNTSQMKKTLSPPHDANLLLSLNLKKNKVNLRRELSITIRFYENYIAMSSISLLCNPEKFLIKLPLFAFHNL